MSLDFGLLAKLILGVTSPSNKEKYENGTDKEAVNLGIDVGTIVSIILSAILGVIAFILSWSCNSALGYHTFVKAVFGTFAFVFGFTYIILYLLLRWDTCNALIVRRRR